MTRWRSRRLPAPHLEIDALLDGEAVDCTPRAALDDPAARDYLVEALILRQIAHEMEPSRFVIRARGAGRFVGAGAGWRPGDPRSLGATRMGKGRAAPASLDPSKSYSMRPRGRRRRNPRGRFASSRASTGRANRGAIEMRFTAVCLASAIVCSAPTAWAQIATSQETPIVYVGLFSVSQKGTRGHAALTAEKAGQDISGMLSISPCGGGSAGTAIFPVSAFATDVWLMTGKTLEMNDQQASIQLEWRRLRTGGLDETSAPESTTLTLKRGERRTLETLSFPPAGSCDARTSSLDVVFGTRQEISGVSPLEHAPGSVGGGGSVPVGSHRKWRRRHPFAAMGLTADLRLARTARTPRRDAARHRGGADPGAVQLAPMTSSRRAGR